MAADEKTVAEANAKTRIEDDATARWLSRRPQVHADDRLAKRATGAPTSCYVHSELATPTLNLRTRTEQTKGRTMRMKTIGSMAACTWC
jgi:hypothetical protein